MQAISLVIEFDLDGDAIENSVDNCPELANADQTDTDTDGAGNVCDDDDDNDTIPDEVELGAGLNPLDPDDATLDLDGDGRNNADEFAEGGNIDGDDVAPVITAPRSIVMPSTGLLTRVDVGSALATDNLAGPLTPTNGLGSDLFEPGRHVIEWRAEDDEGNEGVATQIIEVLPIISVAEGQVAGEGGTVRVDLKLSGEAPNDNASVAYTLSGSATSSDHSLIAGRALFVDESASIVFTLLQDNTDEPEENLILTLSNATDAVLGENRSHTVRIQEDNIAPEIALTISQAGNRGLIVAQSLGQVTVEARVSDPNGDETLTVNWSQTQDDILDIASDSERFLVFDPASLNTGFYELVAEVSDLRTSTLTRVLLEVSAANTIADRDEDGIDDSEDLFDQRFAMQVSANGDQYIESEAHLRIAQGNASRRLGLFNSELDAEELAAISEQTNAETTTPSGSVLSPIYDFVIHGLSSAGEVVKVVLPLDSALLSESVYYKYRDGAWQRFSEDENNRLESSPLIEGVCPGPNSDEYAIGLNTGDLCVRLNIEDGGPNDSDGLRNGVIEDPGVFIGSGQSSDGGQGNGGSGNENGGIDAPGSGSSGGGVIQSQIMAILVFLWSLGFLLGHRRRIQKRG
jgi:hypothetical protein